MRRQQALHLLKGATGCLGVELMNRLSVDLVVRMCRGGAINAGLRTACARQFEAAHPEGLRESVEGALADALSEQRKPR